MQLKCFFYKTIILDVQCKLDLGHPDIHVYYKRKAGSWSPEREMDVGKKTWFLALDCVCLRVRYPVVLPTSKYICGLLGCLKLDIE